ncbi:MAG: cobalamin-dependent protein [Deltaproteobacteria bacterium]|nr:cobalamin-dependent protein [Deltaproteobacteria bacterium]
MKIHLLETGDAQHDPFAQCWYTTDDRRFAVPLLAMPVVGSFIPREHEVSFYDQKVHSLEGPARDCDLACISFKTKDAKRTYRLADELRAAGTKVILGGVHASLDPEEAARHADAVVAGEAEGIFAQVLKDAERGQLQRIYRAPQGVALDASPMPRFDLIDNERYWVHAVQTSRGCLVGCDFCPIQRIFGGRTRHKAVERVLAEVDRVHEIDPQKDIFFIDEMFCGGDRAYQRALLAGLRQRKIDFYCISDFKVMDLDYVEELAESGCKMLVLNMPGTCFPHEVEAIRAIQRMGVSVWGFFMFGFSFHDAQVFSRVADLVEESDMKQVTLTVITPFPNTPLAQRLAATGGLLTDDTDLFDQCHVVCAPERFDAPTLQEGFLSAWQRLEPRFAISSSSGRTTQSEHAARAITREEGREVLHADLQLRHERGILGKEVDLMAAYGTDRFEVAVTPYNVLERRYSGEE